MNVYNEFMNYMEKQGLIPKKIREEVHRGGKVFPRERTVMVKPEAQKTPRFEGRTYLHLKYGSSHAIWDKEKHDYYRTPSGEVATFSWGVQQREQLKRMNTGEGSKEWKDIKTLYREY